MDDFFFIYAYRTYSPHFFVFPSCGKPFSDPLIYFIKLAACRDLKKNGVNAINEALSQKFHPYSIFG